MEENKKGCRSSFLSPRKYYGPEAAHCTAWSQMIIDKATGEHLCLALLLGQRLLLQCRPRLWQPREVKATGSGCGMGLQTADYLNFSVATAGCWACTCKGHSKVLTMVLEMKMMEMVPYYLAFIRLQIILKYLITSLKSYAVGIAVIPNRQMSTESLKDELMFKHQKNNGPTSHVS